MTVAQIFVVGMHRSGTSAVTNLLANMGAYFGEEKESIGSNPENPKGFWERRDVRWANDNLLHSQGCEWDALSHWQLGSLDTTDISAFQEEVAAIYEKLSAAGKSFVIKDPRLCLLLPLWLECSSQPLVVYVHRNPEEVARSLQSRNGYPMEFGLRLWETYATHALHYSRQVPTLFVDYEAVLADEMGQAQRLFEFFQANRAAGLSLEESNNIQGTVEAGLRNQQASLGDSLLSDSQHQLHHTLKRLCAGESADLEFPLVLADSTDRDECLRALEKYHRTKQKYDELQVYKDHLKARIQHLDDSIRPIRRQYHQLQYERNLLQRFDLLPCWVARSLLVRLLMSCARPFSGISPVGRTLAYYDALVELMNTKKADSHE